jgi:hypothetical protein
MTKKPLIGVLQRFGEYISTFFRLEKLYAANPSRSYTREINSGKGFPEFRRNILPPYSGRMQHI